jgi:hypothetical protein
MRADRPAFINGNEDGEGVLPDERVDLFLVLFFEAAWDIHAVNYGKCVSLKYT